jgi:hypothetical protein
MQLARVGEGVCWAGTPSAAVPLLLGPADYVSHETDRPMAITWRLRQAMSTEVFVASGAAVA